MLNWHLILGIASGVLAFIAIVPYIKDILYGTTRPNIVSWSLWVLILVIALWAQISAGPSWSLVFLIGDLIGTTTIFILCLVGFGYGKYNWLDVVCFALAIIAILLWQITHQPLLAIALAAVADFLASIPTLVKAYKDPKSEDPTQFLMIAVAALLGIFSTVLINPANLIFPIYLLGINSAIGITALTRKGMVRS